MWYYVENILTHPLAGVVCVVLILCVGIWGFVGIVEDVVRRRP